MPENLPSPAMARYTRRIYIRTYHMAINPETLFPGKINPSDADYPFGSARNITTPGDGTGTPFVASLVNDTFGFQQAMLAYGGAVPSGDPETALVSQYLNALLVGNDARYGVAFATTAAMQAALGLTVGQRLVTNEFSTGNGGGGVYVVEAGDTSNGFGRLLVIGTNTAVLQSDSGVIDKQYGVPVDGVTDSSTAIQSLLDNHGVTGVIFTNGQHLVGSTVTIPAGSKIIFQGKCEFVPATVFTGDYIFQPDAGVSLVSEGLTRFDNLINNTAGITAIGNSTGDFSFWFMSGDFRTDGVDWGIRFDGTAVFPLKADWGNWYFNKSKNGDIAILEATPGSTGQSAFTFGNIIGAEQSSVSVSAQNIVEQENTPSTSFDRLTWDATGGLLNGWTIMRRLTASSGDAQAWEFVELVPQATLTFDAAKSPSVAYDYVVLITRVGVSLSGIRSVHFDQLQIEDISVSLKLEECRAVSIGAMYNEWRNDVTNPATTPTDKGPALVVDTSDVLIDAMFTTESGAIAQVINGSLSIGSGVLTGDAYLVKESNTTTDRSINLDGCSLETGITQIISTFDQQSSRIRQTDSASHRVEYDHRTKTEISAQFRGTSKAGVKADVNDGTLFGSKFDVTMANKNLAPPIQNAGTNTSVSSGVLSQLLQFTRTNNLGFMADFSYLVVLRDNGSISRVVESGTLKISGMTKAGAAVVSATKSDNTQDTDASRTLTVAFSVVDDNATTTTVSITVTSSVGTDSLFVYLVPTASINATAIVQS